VAERLVDLRRRHEVAQVPRRAGQLPLQAAVVALVPARVLAHHAAAAVREELACSLILLGVMTSVLSF